VPSCSSFSSLSRVSCAATLSAAVDSDMSLQLPLRDSTPAVPSVLTAATEGHMLQELQPHQAQSEGFPLQGSSCTAASAAARSRALPRAMRCSVGRSCASAAAFAARRALSGCVGHALTGYWGAAGDLPLANRP
jgi:hypothetical protein